MNSRNPPADKLRTLAPATLLLLLLTGPLLADSAPPQPPLPETYLATGDYTDYVRQTEQWLDASPDSAAAPRVALDLYIAAIVTGDDATVRTMQKVIILNYPISVSGQYLVLQLKDADEFSALMSDIADDNVLAPPLTFPARYDAAIRVGTTRFGPDALGFGPRVLRTALIARDARDDDMERVCVDRLHQENADDCLKIYAIVTNPALSAGDRLEALHGLPDRQLSLPFENFVLAEMTPAERDVPDILVIRADDDLDFGKISEALPLLDRIPVEAQDPRLVFWRACAWTATGDTATGLDLLSKLSAAHPESLWATHADELAPIIQNLDSSRTRTVEGLLRPARAIHDKWDQFQATATYTNSLGVPIDIYVAVVRGQRFDLYIAQAGKMVLAYESTDHASALMTAGQTTYETSDEPGVVPVPALSFYRQGEGFSFNVNINIGISPDQVADGISNLLASPYLSTRDGMQDLFLSNQRRAIFAAPPSTASDGSISYSFVLPQVHSPTFSTVQFVATPDGSLSGVTGDGFSISKLRYGPAGSFPIDGLPVNPADHVSDQKLDPSALRKLLPVVMALFDPPPALPTTRPDSSN